MSHIFLRPLSTFLTLLLVTSAHAGMEVRVDDTTIDSMQTVQLQLRITGTSDIDALDLSPLDTNFEVQGTSQQSQLRMVNGQASSWVDLQITLRPRSTGVLTIPPLKIGGEQSEPLTIEVRAIDPGLQTQIDQLVYFEVELDRNEVYVRAQLLYTRKLYYTSGVQIYGDLPGAPDVPNAVVLTLGETSQNITMRGDTRYGVLEQRYAIFPESSGSLKIPGFSIAASIVLPDGRRGIRVPAPEKTLPVLPIPATFPKDATWLPAREIRLNESWEPELGRENRKTLASGKTIRRTLTVDVIGNTGSSIPPLTTTLNSPLIRQYPEAPALTDDLFGAHVTGRRVQAENLFPTWGGDVEVPPAELTWWDTEARVIRIATLAAQSRSIQGDPPPAAVTLAADPDATQAPITAAQQTTQTVENGETTGSAPGGLNRTHVFIAIAVLALLAIFVVYRRWCSERVLTALQQANAGVMEAIRAADPRKLREALINAAITGQHLHRHRAIEQMRADPEWRSLHEALGSALYRASGEGDVNARATPAQCSQAKSIARRLLRRAPDSPLLVGELPPLYDR